MSWVEQGQCINWVEQGQCINWVDRGQCISLGECRAGFAFRGALGPCRGAGPPGSLVCQFCFVKYTFDKIYHVVYNVTNSIHST